MNTHVILIILLLIICIILLFVLRRQSKIIELRNYEKTILEDKLSRTKLELEQKRESSEELHRDFVIANKEIEELKKAIEFYENIEEASKTLNAEESLETSNNDVPVSSHIQEKEVNSDSVFAKEEKKSSQSQDASKQTILDDEQSKALCLLLKKENNCFITGKAGTGKSFLLKYFRKEANRKTLVLAPTGIAALNVEGSTLHSTFGYHNLVNLPVDEISIGTIQLKSEKQLVLKEVDTIIIDEVSMVRADTFEKIDKILRAITKKEKPFGGKQMVLFGDLFQLPPIAQKAEHQYLNDRYGSIYFFDTATYKAGNFQFIELTVNHRQQGDITYFEVLNRFREGKIAYEDIALINTRVIKDESIYDRYTIILPKKEEVEKINAERISLLKTKEYVYHAKILTNREQNQNWNIESIFPIAKDLILKKGALVMMVSNDLDHRWANGTLGIVKDLTKESLMISIKGQTYEILPQEFTEQEAVYEEGQIRYKDMLTVLQYPVIPAYAITIHKSQGQTYNNIIVDLKKCFEKGQAYVALSRCKSLEGLHLRSRITEGCIRVDTHVVEFCRAQK